MKELSNKALLEEFQRRLNAGEKALAQKEDMLKELNKLNKKLEKAEALKSHFISNIKNEINNPLTSILALSHNLLRKQNLLTEEAKRSLSLIYKEAHTLDFQLANIITAAEIEAGESVPQLVNIHVNDNIQSVIKTFESSIKAKLLAIKISGDDDARFVTDNHYFKVIVSNLISNAIKFNKEGGQVNIEIAEGVDHLTLQVSNTGKSIKEDELPQIFDRFSQVEMSNVKDYLGYGLGLSVTRDLVEILNGSIEVVSSDNETVFKVKLPLNPDNSDKGMFGEDTEFLFDQSY